MLLICTPHLSLSICCQVVHLCHIHQFDSIAGQRRPDMTYGHKIMSRSSDS